ncbi:DoxX family protein [Conyzicola nivalis]|uniref:DoxX family membrane protein n=1 Tax=Conyzicola nivalis TaxID=1477021 RepID=A0A916SKN3_9MICO|nr:DoxX family membrane protein [Conyzicola nivalis]GGB02124.1 hypothetical protein GCM10010979_15910 [Conyzicola nivalis]
MGDAALDVIQAIVLCALVLLFVGMGVNHFRRGPARVMAAMIPPRLRRRGLPKPMTLVYLTGVCEIAGGLGLAFPVTRLAAYVALIVFLVAVFPANAYAAKHPEKFGRGAIPFWPRLAGQAVLIALLVFVVL